MLRLNVFCCLLIAALLLFTVPGGAQNLERPSQLKDGIKTSTVSKVGLGEQKLSELDIQLQTEFYPNIHSLLVYKDHRLVYERYKAGQDFNWGRDIGVVDHNIETLHDMRSISKSVISACIGIAITRGEIESVDQKVFDFFEEYKVYDVGDKVDLTIAHLLTMTSGLEWNENIPYNNPENSEIQMSMSKDPIEFILSRPLDTIPGTKWNYNGGTTQLLALIIERTTGMKADKFAAKYLFEPLGITQWEWTKLPGTEDPAAASGLRLRSRDLLKFGILYLNGGSWDKQQVVDTDWVSESLQSHIVKSGPDDGYGYQFWTWTDAINGRVLNIAAAIGNGDQRVFIDKTDNLLVIVTAGNYNNWDIENNAYALFKKVVDSVENN